MLSDYDVEHPSTPVNKYVFQTDILGASEYISDLLGYELESFLKKRGYRCKGITSNGFCIEIVISRPLVSNDKTVLNSIMMQFIKEKLSTVRMEMIPNVTRENEESIKKYVKKESQG